MKIAGIKSTTTIQSSIIGELKQALLFFDLIGIPLLNRYMDIIEKIVPDREESLYLLNELELLIDKGYVFDAWSSTTTKISDKIDFKAFANEYQTISNYFNQTNDLDISEDAAARLCALRLNNQHDPLDFTSIPVIKKLILPNTNDLEKCDLIKIVIEKLPIPRNDTPWENIFEYKSDKDSIGKLAALKVWINKSLKSGNSIQEVRDELDSLIYEYEKSLSIHKIQYGSGIFQAMVIGSAELLENALKLKFSNIAKNLFSASQVKANLLKAELESPGKEVAYIVNSLDKFK